MTLFNDNPNSINLSIEHTQFSHNLFHFIKQHVPHDQPTVILCIGTDRSTGDSLGPFVGHYLTHKPISKLHVYGTIDNPVHAKNLEETILHIHEQHFNPFIIAIDAALSSMKKVNSVETCLGSLTPGAAVRKDLPDVGHLSIKGYVNVSGFMDFSVLQNTRLSVVMNMAKQIAQALYYTDNHLKQHHSVFKLKGAQ